MVACGNIILRNEKETLNCFLESLDPHPKKEFSYETSGV